MLDPQAALFAVLWGAAGWLAAIPLNVVIHQLPRENAVGFRPRCEKCGAVIPLVALRNVGTCRCGHPRRYDRVEWLLAAAFLPLGVRFGPSWALLAYSLYTMILLGIAAIDLRHRYVYRLTTLPPLVLALFLTPILVGANFRVDVLFTVAGAILCAGIFGALYVAGRLIWRGQEPIGRGDIEVAALVGAMEAFPRAVGALILGSVINAGFIAVLLATRRRRAGDYIPYGPGLCLGAYVTFFFPP